MKCEMSGAARQMRDERRALRSASCVARHTTAFSLVEVMIALAIFFMAVFAILGLMSSVLRNARLLQSKKGVDAGMVAARLALTNKLTLGVDSGDFGDMYPDYSWMTDTYPDPNTTNGLFQVDIVVQRNSGSKPVESQMSILRFSPDTPTSGPQ